MRIAAIALILLTGACAAPDVSSFKKSTLALTTSLNENQAALVASGEDISQKLGSPESLNTNLTTLKKQGKKVQLIAGVMATYTNSVARLSSAGEEGEKAANEFVSDLETTISNLSGDQTELPSSLGALTQALGKLQQLSKNKELYEVMKEVKDEINGMAAELATLQNAESIILGGLETYWRSARPDLNNYHGAYEQLMARFKRLNDSGGLALNNALKACIQTDDCDYASLLKLHRESVQATGDPGDKLKDLIGEIETCVEADNCDQEALLAKHQEALQQDESEIGKLVILINEVSPYEAAYQAWDKEIRDWRKGADARVRTVPSLAKAWQNDHNTIIKYLEDCTRFAGTFRRKCGAFSADNLELFGRLASAAGLPF